MIVFETPCRFCTMPAYWQPFPDFDQGQRGAAGDSHTVYLKGDGTVWAVGYNGSGQLGDGTTTERINPVQVVDGSGNPLSGVVGISAGEAHTVYLKGDGTVLGGGLQFLPANWGTAPSPIEPTRYRWWTDRAIR